MKEVLLVGFGAVGAIYSLVLKKSGLARVTVVARSNYDLVRTEGMVFKSKKYGEVTGWKPDRVFSSVAEAADTTYDYVVVATKAIPDVMKSSTILSPLLTVFYTEKFGQPAYVLLQNGLNVEADLYHSLRGLNQEPKIISAAVYIGTNLVSPNSVAHSNLEKLTLGWYRHNDFTTMTHTPEQELLLQGIHELLEKGGSDVEIVPEIQRMKFRKNFRNIAFSSWSTLTRQALPAIFRPPPTDPSVKYAPYVSPKTAELINTYTIPAIAATLEELVVLARALGFPDSDEGIPSDMPEDAIQAIKAMHSQPDSTHKMSMLLDVEKDQPIEVEVIVGEVVRMAKKYNVLVPRIETVYALLLVVQNQILRKMETRP